MLDSYFYFLFNLFLLLSAFLFDYFIYFRFNYLYFKINLWILMNGTLFVLGPFKE